MAALKDLTGQQFGDFKVISRAPNRITPKGQAVRVWHCQCLRQSKLPRKIDHHLY